MSTTTTEPTSATPVPTPADVAAQQARQEGEQPATQENAPTGGPDEPGEPGEQGRGSKDAILADLARERDKRQAAESAATDTAAKLDAVLTALGLNGDSHQTTPDVDQLTADLARERAETAVLRAGHGIADVDALLDSRAFTSTLADVDTTDRAAVKAHVEQYVQDQPRFALAHQTPAGVRDAAAGRDHQPGGRTEKQQFADFLAGISRT